MIRVLRRLVNPEYLWHGWYAAAAHASTVGLSYVLAWTTPGIHPLSTIGVLATAAAALPYAFVRTGIDAVFRGWKPR